MLLNVARRQFGAGDKVAAENLKELTASFAVGR